MALFAELRVATLDGEFVLRDVASSTTPQQLQELIMQRLPQRDEHHVVRPPLAPRAAPP